MASGLNKVYLLGNLGQDPELRVTQGGQSVLRLRVATSETWLDKNRVRQERTEWHGVTIWGKRAEALSKFLKKGAKVFIEGSLRHSSYDDRDNIKRYVTEVVASNVILGGGAKARSAPNDPDRRGPNRRDHYDGKDDAGDDGGGGEDYGNGGGFNSGGDDDIPFACITRGAREPWWRF